MAALKSISRNLSYLYLSISISMREIRGERCVERDVGEVRGGMRGEMRGERCGDAGREGEIRERCKERCAGVGVWREEREST
jgi:hypothetical protein